MKNNIFNIFYLFIYIFFVLKKYFLKLEWRINLLWRIWILSYKETLEPRFWGRSWLPGVCDVLQSNFNATVTLMFAFCKTNVVYQIIRSCEPDNRISQRHRSLHRAESNRSSTVPRTTTQTSSQHLHNALSLILLVPDDAVFSVRHCRNLRSKSTLNSEIGSKNGGRRRSTGWQGQANERSALELLLPRSFHVLLHRYDVVFLQTHHPRRHQLLLLRSRPVHESPGSP